MPNPKLKNRIQASTSVDPMLWSNVQELSKQTRVPIGRLLDEAMEDLLKKYQFQNK